MRLQLVQELIPGPGRSRSTKDGDDYTQARRAFNVLLAQHGQAMYFASRYVGGLKTQPQPQGRQGRQAAGRAGRCASAARRAGTARRERLQRQAVPVPAGAVQPARLVELVALGHEPADPQGLRRARRRPACGRSGSSRSCCRRVTLERMHDAELKVAGRSRRADHGRADSTG